MRRWNEAGVGSSDARSPETGALEPMIRGAGTKQVSVPALHVDQRLERWNLRGAALERGGCRFQRCTGTRDWNAGTGDGRRWNEAGVRSSAAHLPGTGALEPATCGAGTCDGEAGEGFSAAGLFWRWNLALDNSTGYCCRSVRLTLAPPRNEVVNLYFFMD